MQTEDGLAEFLLARIAEDEAVARVVAERDTGPDWLCEWDTDVEGIATPAWNYLRRLDPARVLAKCEADRAIVEFYRERSVFQEGDAYGLGVWRGLDQAVRLLALPYADHPDYRPEWKP